MKMMIQKGYIENPTERAEIFEFDLQKKPSIWIDKFLDLDYLGERTSPYGHIRHRCFTKVPKSGRFLVVAIFREDYPDNPHAREYWYFNADTSLIFYE